MEIEFKNIIEDITISSILGVAQKKEYKEIYTLLDAIFISHKENEIVANTYFYRVYPNSNMDTLYVDDKIFKDISIINSSKYPRTLLKQFYRHKFHELSDTKYQVIFHDLNEIKHMYNKLQE